MSEPPFVGEDLILTKVTEKSFERGEEYYESGMVESAVQRGSRLFAEVLGSEEDPYRVGVSFRGETSPRPARVHTTGAATASIS